MFLEAAFCGFNAVAIQGKRMRELSLDELTQVSGGRDLSGGRSFDSTQDPDGSEIWDYFAMHEYYQDQYNRTQRIAETMKNPVLIDWDGDGTFDEQGFVDGNGTLIGAASGNAVAAGNYVWADSQWNHSASSISNPDSEWVQFWNDFNNTDRLGAAQHSPGMLANFLDHLIRQGNNAFYDNLRDSLFGGQTYTPIQDAVPLPGSYHPPIDPYSPPVIPQGPSDVPTVPVDPQ